LQKNHLVLVYGKYNPGIYAYTRELDNKKILVSLNFKNQNAISNTGLDLENAKVLIGNYQNPSTNGGLQPYEAVVYEEAV
jgi:oligo-1,6-glucosidase